MSEKSAQILREAKNSDKSIEEAMECQKEINNRVNWNIQEMLPEIVQDNE